MYGALLGLTVAVVLAAGEIRDRALEEREVEAASRAARAGLVLLEVLQDPDGGDGLSAVPAVLRALEGRVGYEAAVYVAGGRRGTSDPGFGPSVVVRDDARPLEDPFPDVAIRRISLPGRVGLLATWEEPSVETADAGVLAARSSPPASPPAVGLGWPAAAGAATVLFLLGWAVLPRGRALLTLLPLAGALWATGWTGAAISRDGMDALRRELALSAALLEELPPEAPPATLERITGFPVSLLVDRELRASSLPGSDPRRRAVADAPLPPPGRTTVGSLRVQGERHVYLAQRRRGREVTVLVAPAPAAAEPGSALPLLLLALLAVGGAWGFIRFTRSLH